MAKQIDDLIAEDMKRSDEVYFSLGDALDVKASVVLVVVTFLGTLAGQILSRQGLTWPMTVVQLVSIVALCVVGLLVLRCLWLKPFQLPPEPTDWTKWKAELAEHFRKTEESSDALEAAMTAEFEKQRTRGALERISENSKLTGKKSHLLKWSFRLLGVAVALELLSLIWLALVQFHLRKS